MKCNHEWYEREAALIDGMCPLCLSNNIVDGVSAADRVALLRADVERLYSERTTLMSVVASARERAEHAEERLADAQSALRYIESRYGRLDGVGWDRVLSPDSASEYETGEVCEACGGTGKAYLLHSRAERPCPVCQADQPKQSAK